MKPTTAPAFPDPKERLERSLLSHLNKAVHDWRLIEDGDKVMVGLSGGKDSYTLLHLLGLWQKRAPLSFELLAVNLDQGQPGFDATSMEAYLRQRGISYRLLSADTYSVVKQKVPEGKTYCSLCSRLRRGKLYDAAAEFGCTKLALGHHRDDAIETLLLNLFFEGQLKAMPARLSSDDGRNVVIRPLIYAPEEQIAEFATLMQFPLIACDLCGSQENLKRKELKALLCSLEERYPNLKSSILNALSNVRAAHLLDPALAKEAPPEQGGTRPFPERLNP